MNRGLALKKTILFTGGGGAGNEAIWRILSPKYNLYFADCDLGNINPIIPIANRVSVSAAGDKNFLIEIESICRKLDVDVLVPGVDEELLLLANNIDKFDCTLYIPHQKFIESSIDKLKCAELLKKADLDVPDTQQLENRHLLSFPMIVKPKVGRGSKGVMILESEEQVLAYLTLNKLPEKSVIAQELIEGQEYTVQVSSNKSKELNCILPLRVNQKRGVTISAEIDMNSKIISYVKALHSYLPTQFIYNLQCILTSDGKVMPFEINPRISTTFCVALASGFDPFDIYNKPSSGLYIPGEEISLHRTWANNFIHC